MDHDRILTFEETAGTKTFHLPFRKDPERPPQMTIMVKRMEDGTFHVGYAICSLEDDFSKREGRSRALLRLTYAPYTGLICPSAEAVVEGLEGVAALVNERRPLTVTLDTCADLRQLGHLDRVFDRLDKNREEKEKQSA